MRVLVTGAAGFLGRHILDRLAKDLQVRAFDIHPAEGCADCVVGSVADAAVVSGAVKGMDAIVIGHMAPNRPEIYGSPEIPFDVNVKGTAHLFHSAVETGIRRVVLISSIGTVHDPKAQPVRYTRGSPLAPCSLYALTKTLQEEMALYFHRNHGLEIAVLRPAYIVREDTLVDKYGRQRPTVNWQFIDPRDIAEATAAALRAPGLGYEVFYMVAGPDADAHADMENARRILGWKPAHTFSQYPKDA
jgi:nucleoside-diphosphate-sugar epimerase